MSIKPAHRRLAAAAAAELSRAGVAIDQPSIASLLLDASYAVTVEDELARIRDKDQERAELTTLKQFLCRRFDLPPEQLYSRRMPHSTQRRIGLLLARQLTGASKGDIGRAFGMCKSSVQIGCKAMLHRFTNDQDFRDSFVALRSGARRALRAARAA